MIASYIIPHARVVSTTSSITCHTSVATRENGVKLFWRRSFDGELSFLPSSCSIIYLLILFLYWFYPRQRQHQQAQKHYVWSSVLNETKSFLLWLPLLCVVLFNFEHLFSSCVIVVMVIMKHIKRKWFCQSIKCEMEMRSKRYSSVSSNSFLIFSR